MFRALCVPVCLSGITLSCAKMAEPIEMPFGVPTTVDPRNHSGSADLLQEEGHFLRGPFVRIL